MKTPKSIYYGVSATNIFGTGDYWWRSRITVNGKTKTLGNYKTQEMAAEAYNVEAKKLGRKLNKIKLPKTN